LNVPSLDWNRKWGAMIAGFARSRSEEHFGDRWGDPALFKPLFAVRRRFLDPYLAPGQEVVEIGSGGGRWTRYLLAQAARLTVVELNPEAFDYLRARFPADVAKLRFYRTAGYEMAEVATASADLVFTFDVFVHLEPEGIAAYLGEIERVLKPGGRAVVHYGDVDKPIAAANRGFSRMTRPRMEALLAATGLNTLDHDSEILFHSNLVALEK
jgi:SAM-dependent methyltransferase